MIEIPLAFVISLIAILIAVAMGTAARLPRSARVPLLAFPLLLALMAALIGLRFGYGWQAVARWQPVLAMMLSPTLFLGLRALTEDPPRPWRKQAIWHGWPVALVTLHLLIPGLVPIPSDLFVFSSMGFYLVALLRLSRLGQDIFIHVSGEGYRFVRLGLIAGTALLGFVLLVDLTIFVSGHLFAAEESDALVQLGTAAIAIGMLALAGMAAHLLARRTGSDREVQGFAAAPARGEVTEQDIVTLDRLDHLMRDHQLYRDSELTIARVARRLHLPARDVSRAVNRVRDVNFSYFVNELRVEHAKHLLATTDAPVTEVMLESGFMTKSNFNATFRGMAGVTPTQFRDSAVEPL